MLSVCPRFINFANRRQPFCVLCLDAESAFKTSHEKSETTGPFIIMYNNSRLMKRTNYLDWDKASMGPVQDERCLEQGGGNSRDFYKIFGKHQLSIVRLESNHWTMWNITVSAGGQADDYDDTALLSNNTQHIQTFSGIPRQVQCKTVPWKHVPPSNVNQTSLSFNEY